MEINSFFVQIAVNGKTICTTNYYNFYNNNKKFAIQISLTAFWPCTSSVKYKRGFRTIVINEILGVNMV